jgi:predicted O-methyltransferase YrrM
MISNEQVTALKQIATAFPAQKPEGTASTLKWFHNQHAIIFDQLLKKKPNGLYMELGTWTGAGSAAFVAKHFPEMTIICVDTFVGSAEHLKDKVQKEIADNLWTHFCLNSWEAQNRIYPIKGKSVDGLKRVAEIGLNPDFIYIDAAHDVDSVFADVSTAIQLFPNAVIFGDDYTLPAQRGHIGVYNGINRAIENKLIDKAKLKTSGRVWYLTNNLK